MIPFISSRVCHSPVVPLTPHRPPRPQLVPLLLAGHPSQSLFFSVPCSSALTPPRQAPDPPFLSCWRELGLFPRCTCANTRVRARVLRPYRTGASDECVRESDDANSPNIDVCTPSPCRPFPPFLDKGICAQGLRKMSSACKRREVPKCLLFRVNMPVHIILLRT